MIECELKTMLSHEEYKTILSFPIKAVNSKTQINYYYDTIDLKMNKCGTTCRIRKKDDQYCATIKTHLGNKGFQSDEQSIYIGRLFDDKCFTDLGLTLFGYLVTERTVIFSHDGVTVMLDKNSYFDCIDYEMEIEYQENCEETAWSLFKIIAEKLHNHNTRTDINDFCQRVYSSNSKSNRFFEYLKSYNNIMEYKYNAVTNRPD